MRVVHATPGDLDIEGLGPGWILVFGGVTRQGSRRAMRAVRRASESDLGVIWFDGFGDPPLPIETSPQPTVLIVDIRRAESETRSAQLRSGGRLLDYRSTRLAWKVGFRRMGQMTRARTLWTIVRADVRRLKTLTAPSAIICGDDYAITSAWHAGRIWPSATIDTHLQEA